MPPEPHINFGAFRPIFPYCRHRLVIPLKIVHMFIRIYLAWPAVLWAWDPKLISLLAVSENQPDFNGKHV